MTALLTATALVLLVWACVGPAFVGLGLLVRRPFDSGPATRLGLLECFWAGLAVTLLVVQAWALLAPVNAWLLALLLAGGAFGLAWRREDLRAALRGVHAVRSRLLIAAVAVIWIAHRATGPCDIGDSGLYHFPIIRWANAYPAVPGLSNLSPAYAINNSSLLLTALLNTGPLAGRGEHFTNGLLLSALALQVVRGLARTLRAPVDAAPDAGPSARVADAFDGLLIAPLLLYALGREVSTPTTDLPCGVVLATMASAWLRSLDRLTPWRLVLILTLAAAAITVKLSAGLFAAAIGLTAMARVRHVHGLRRPVLAGCALGLLLIGPWLTRNVIQSGYPLYPSGAMGLPVAWRAPPDHLTFLYDAITKHAKGGMQVWLSDALARTPARAYARLMTPPFATSEGVAGLNWLPSWLFTQPLVGPVELVLPMLLAACAIWPAWRADRRTTRLLLVTTVPAILFWLLQSPDRRYIWATTWTLGGGLLAVATVRWREPARGARAVLVVAAVAAVVAVGYRVGLIVILRGGNPLTQIPFIRPGPDHGFWTRPQADLVPWQSDWGTTVYTNRPGEPVQVWAHDPPAAAWPPPDPGLKLRRPGDLASGFVIERQPTTRPQ
ncbi:MAG TPA: hypothetical protein VF595_11040 [Tepidisphaeraceae bacterium]